MAKRAYWLCRVIREAIYGHVWAAYVLKRTTTTTTATTTTSHTGHNGQAQEGEVTIDIWEIPR